MKNKNLIGNVGQRRHKKLPKRLSFAGRTQRVKYAVCTAQDTREGKYVVLQYGSKRCKPEHRFRHVVRYFKTKKSAQQWLKDNKG